MKKAENTILYVDDEIQNLEGFKITFYDEYTVFTASSAKEALAIIKKEKIKIVISDQRMPEMSGLELLLAINREFPEIVCIILTAYADTEAVIQAVNQGGVYRFLLKPWSELELKITINNALELYHYRTENKSLLEDLKIKNQELLETNNDLKKITLVLQEREFKLKEQNEEYLSVNEELSQTIEELARAKEKAEESDLLKKAFLQNMSHEIRTPLNAILGFANLLKSPEITLDDVQKYSEIIINGGNQLLAIVTDILTISSIDAGQEKLNETIFNINDLVNDLRLMFLPMANQKSLSLYLKPNSNIYQENIRTDKTKLQQILTNLITNSIKYTHSGYIEFGYTLKNKLIEFYVKDTGIGINKNYHNVIFDRFRQIAPENNNLFGGTGLGLAISKAHAELLGGHIWLESEPGIGSTFFFAIPYHPEDGSLRPNHADHLSIGSQSNLTILVAEDEKNNFLFIRELLKPIATTILHAQNGEEAIELFQTNPPINLILMDIKMPGMDGIEAAQHIRKINPSIPIIAQTAFTSLERDILSNTNFDGYISKPINKNKLFTIIAQLTKK
jgi:signal transduction histidine kinase